jgi:hypothetical protein
MPIILATQEAEIRRITVQSHPGQIVHKTLSRKKLSPKKGGLAEWLKVKALSSSPSTAKKKFKNLLKEPGLVVHTCNPGY